MVKLGIIQNIRWRNLYLPEDGNSFQYLRILICFYRDRKAPEEEICLLYLRSVIGEKKTLHYLECR
jgi:hypothetical protein